MRPLAELLIDLDVVLVLVHNSLTAGGVVVGNARTVGQRHQFEQRQRLRRKVGVGNEIVGKRRRTGHGIDHAGVVNLPRECAPGSDVLAEIAAVAG
jgi:hypothetical protein